VEATTTTRRDKVFIIVAVFVFVFLLVLPPVAYIADRFGVLPLEDMANYKDPERLYFFDFENGRVTYLPFWDGVARLSGVDIPDDPDDGFTMPNLRQEGVPLFARMYISVMNGLQRTRAEVQNVYTNFLPFYAQMQEFENFNNRIDSDLAMIILDMETAFSNWVRGPVVAVAPSNINGEDTSGTGSTQNNTGSQNIIRNHDSFIVNPRDVIVPYNWPPLVNSRIPSNLNELQFVATRITDTTLFRHTRVRARDGSFGFIDTGKALTYDQARANMYRELESINRIAAASQVLGVNFFVYFATTAQSTPWYNSIIPLEFSSYEMKRYMFDNLENVDGLAYLDLSTLERRLTYKWMTDHHKNAYGSARAYLEIHHMFSRVIPDFREPFQLLEIRYFPDVLFRGSSAGRSGMLEYHDYFAVPIFDLPAFHPSHRVTNRLNDYMRGAYNNRNNPRDTRNHYGHFYSNRPNLLVVPENDTGRNLLLIGDSMRYWIKEPIAAHFDRTYIVSSGSHLDLASCVERNNIADVLLLQYGPRTLARAVTAETHLEAIVTR